MMKTNKSASDAIKTLNELLKLDKEAISKLINNRIVCNNDLADHETCQVGIDEQLNYIVGTLGVINAIFGCNQKGHGYIIAKYDDSNELLGFIELNENSNNEEN